MSRGYVINGETLLKVKGHNALSVDGAAALHELGLMSEGVQISPTFHHRDVAPDDFGPNVPADVQWMLADVRVRGTLVHYDREVLEYCMMESMGGATTLGTLAPAGRSLGRGRPALSSGCHYWSLNLLSPVLDRPWRFRTCYLEGNPVEVRLGTGYTGAVINVRAIPYRDPTPSFANYDLNLGSSGAVLWDHTLDQ
jgi:hypothetical protein